MSPESPTPEKPAMEIVNTHSRWKVYFTSGMVVLLLAGAIYYFNRSTDKKVPDPPKKQEPLFHRDEPTEKQIFQGDYKTKVREMLDSGKSVMEISKETKIRIDEVRKIKKDYKKEKSK